MNTVEKTSTGVTPVDLVLSHSIQLTFHIMSPVSSSIHSSDVSLSDRMHWEMAVTKKSVVFVPLFTLLHRALGKIATLKVCRSMSVLTPVVDHDIKRQVFNTLESNNKIFYGSLQLKFT